MRKSHGTMATIRQQERSQLSLPQRHNEKDTRNNGDYTTARKKPALSFFCKDTMRKSHVTMATIRQQERNQLSLSSTKTQLERHTEQWRLYDSKKETRSLFLLQRHNEKDTRNNGDYTTARKKSTLYFFCKDTMRKTHGTMATIRQQERNQLSLPQRHNEKDTRNNGNYTTARKKPTLSSTKRSLQC